MPAAGEKFFNFMVIKDNNWSPPPFFGHPPPLLPSPPSLEKFLHPPPSWNFQKSLSPPLNKGGGSALCLRKAMGKFVFPDF